MTSLLVCSSSVERNGDLVFLVFDGGSQTPGGVTIALSDAHAALLAQRIMEERP